MIARSKSIVGLDIGTSAIKAVELTQRGKEYEVTAFGQVEIPPDSPGGLADSIKELLDEGGFRTRRVVTSVAGKLVVVRFLSMVRMSDEELRNSIAYEAEKYVDFPPAETVLDCQRMEADDENRGSNMTVLMVAARRSLLEGHLETLGQVGITPEVIDVDAFALSNAFSLCAKIGEELDQEAALAFVDVGHSKTTINITKAGISQFTREIPVGGRDLTECISRRLGITFDEAEDLKREPGEGNEAVNEAVISSVDELGNEVQLSLDYFENQFETQVARVFLSGGGARLPVLRGALERIFERPTQMFNPFDYVQVDKGIDPELLSSNAAQLVVAVGLASRVKKA
ncbi:MAG TPA: type IV pilus assembly protein PilM [Planctomycetota bacterium]|jgi:type IV pilus assembly protein PilM|nr:type IV pilus assembly protein PilM [Planctomycetota bacterium]